MPCSSATALSAKRRPPTLSDDEAKNLAAALYHLKDLHGSWTALSSVMGVSAAGVRAIARGSHHPGIGIARRAAVAAGVSVESLISSPGHA